METRINTNNAEETHQLGIRVGKEVSKLMDESPILILLQGDLGAGKTQLTKGIGAALGVSETITSPSYVYMRNYRHANGGELVHIDGWRTTGAQELLDTGIEEFMEAGNVVVIEWPREAVELVQKLGRFNPKVVELSIEEVSEQGREITLRTSPDLEISVV